MAISIERARLYLGIDIEDDEMINANVRSALDTAHATVLSSVGDDIDVYMPGDPRVDQLILAYMADLYNNRAAASKVTVAKLAWIQQMEHQLRLVLRRLKEEEAKSS